MKQQFYFRGGAENVEISMLEIHDDFGARSCGTTRRVQRSKNKDDTLSSCRNIRVLSGRLFSENLFVFDARDIFRENGYNIWRIISTTFGIVIAPDGARRDCMFQQPMALLDTVEL